MDKVNNHITPVGITDFRNSNQPFGIKDIDRLAHIYVVGKTGVGKSTLLQNMAISDIQKGKGIAVIDPHGDVAENLLNYIPKERIKDTIYFNPGDLENPIAFNPLRGVHPKFHHLIASELISTFKKIWADSWGPRLEYILRFTLLTLLEYPHATLLDIQPLLTDQYFRNNILSYTKNTHIISFWKDEFEKYSPAFKSEAISPILNKSGVFLSSIPLRNTVGQKVRGFKIQEIMDTSKIFIANLSKGKIGEDASSLLGSILLTSFYVTALQRSNVPEHFRKPFYLYVDEMHSFISLSFADILSEARKYRLSLFLAHQYIEQLHEKVIAAIFGNVGTLISFRVGATDAEYLAKEFSPVFNENDLVHLEKYSMYLKLMIDGVSSQAFSARTTAIAPKLDSFKEEVIAHCLKRYTRTKEEVDAEILKINSYTPDTRQSNLFLK